MPNLTELVDGTNPDGAALGSWYAVGQPDTLKMDVSDMFNAANAAAASGDPSEQQRFEEAAHTIDQACSR